MIQSLCETFLQFLMLLNIRLPHDPAILLLDAYSFRIKTYVYTKTYKGTCIAPLFVIAKTGSNPNTLNRRRDEQTMIFTCSGILLSNKM